MKAIATILLLAILLVQVFNKWLIITGFNLQKSYIIENLCENRTRPSMHCNGNCILMKKLNQQEKNEKKEVPKSIDVTNIFLSSKSFFPVLDTPPSFCRLKYPYPVMGVKKVDWSSRLFRPPIA